MGNSSLRSVLAAAVAALPAVAHANAGIGLGVFTTMSMTLLFALVVVIPLEAVLLLMIVPASFGRLLWLAIVANLMSTVVGAIVGVVLDMTLATELRRAGIAGFVLAVIAMYALTVWIEHVIVRRSVGDVPRKVVLRAVLVANAVSYVLTVAVAYFMAAAMDSTAHGYRMVEVVNIGSVVKGEAADYFHAKGQFREMRQDRPVPRARAVSTSDKGRVVVEIDYPVLKALDGKTVVFEPEIREGRIVAWRCYVPDAPLEYFPRPCRSRSAAEAVPWSSP